MSTISESWRFTLQAFPGRDKKFVRKQKLKSLYHTMLNPLLTSKWHKALNSEDLLSIAQSFPEIYIKPYRNYLSIQWNTERRLKVILDTYRFANKIGLSKHIYSDKKTKITHVESVNGFVFNLIIEYDLRFMKEGDFTFSIECEELGGRIVAASFSFEEMTEGNWACRIGCIQGHDKNEEYTSKIAQKHLNGLRPKSFVVHAIQEFSRYVNISEIYGVGDEIQTYRGKHLIHLSKKHAIKFDYNKFWIEIGGKSTSDGWFKLPATTIRKVERDLKTCKRALYRRRYVMFDELALKIEDFVHNNLVLQGEKIEKPKIEV
nr:DUF535 family protein [uncultured Flavobacterium sp.]